ncbi:MAG: signal peptidase I [Candidatus Nitrotoga sp.]|nr:signal peptidase I [Candidatus Nitrotoga sp.]RFC41064.1 MAG: signal peptidase I Serine peptidase MEROPS family S26A [Candidatus Nitrotoga sp. CP45]MDO9446705.1 signal peptidase I [Candidatus Nitrotoga sp.]MDP1637852.1 signal peptidase I [Candidatus Nitrotoga sp.]MDP1855034.1 signal peptidase I [Candidatus Nitrotoga sp.]
MDFALIMFVLLLITGSVWLLDRFVLQSKRIASTKEPWWVEYSKSFFPVILAVFMLRSFLVEPFKIPSGSMIPTLQVGDFILVNKFTYGIRLPIISKKLVEINSPSRGDVMVFHYPENPSLDYIKRVVGLPGDQITYRNKKVFVNDVMQEQQPDGDYNYVETALNFVHTERYKENLTGHIHAMLVNPEVPNIHLGAVAEFPYRENCAYSEKEVRCTVPAGHYFMLGDNRDNSRDSRYWGFVPDNMIVGKAFMIWMNFSDLKRIGLSID